jgi:uncharacterized membrane protein
MTRKGKMNRLTALIAGVVLAISVTGTALAANSSNCQAYHTCSTTTTTSTPTITAGTQLSPTVSTTSTVASTLPFTGLDVGLLLAGGAGLLGAGYLVRKLSRHMN